jgi:hypothetical protein
MREETDVSGGYNDDIPDGIYDFEIAKVVRKEVAGKKAYEWTLEYGSEVGKVLTWPNQIADLLPLLGAEKQPDGKYSWDTDLVEGKTFRATVTHQTTKKGKVVCVMGDFAVSAKEESAPF